MKSQIHLIKRDELNTSKWSGGTTTELSIYPPQSSYSDRDFLWRLSSATVEDDESVFTDLPDYNRILMILEGSLELEHDGQKPIVMSEYDIDSFDGGLRTISRGKVTDFNLMMRKGKCEGSVEIVMLEPESTLTDYFMEEVKPSYSRIIDVYYSVGCQVSLSVDESKKIVLDKGDVLVVSKDNVRQTSMFDAWNRETDTAFLVKVKIYC